MYVFFSDRTKFSNESKQARAYMRKVSLFLIFLNQNISNYIMADLMKQKEPQGKKINRACKYVCYWIHSVFERNDNNYN